MLRVHGQNGELMLREYKRLKYSKARCHVTTAGFPLA